ncbi:MAG: ATP-binding cassette domain-containing protein [Acidimicrobiales bacterium]|nr:ATP-binding cassette domain-containing protein [Acidimicrobiales bacterium]
MTAAAAPQHPSPLLRCRDIEVRYGQVQVLFGVDLDVHEGEIVALLGTNGAGKSTLLRAVTGLTPPSAGTVELDGQPVTGADPAELAARGVGFMPGGRAVFPGLSVRENLELAAWLYRDDRRRVDAAIDGALELFPALRARLGERAALLSGGQQQMVALAQTLVAEPRLLLLDELSLGLAPVVVGQLLEVVRDLRDRGLTVLLVEQSVNVALDVADRAVFMEKGEVRFSGAAADLRGRDDLLRSVFIGRGESDGVARDAARTWVPTSAEPVLTARGIGCSFGGVRAVADVDLDVGDGEIVGILGANGAGKTTLLDLLSGFVTADQGIVRLAGEDVTELPPHRRATMGLARTFQDARLFPGLTVAENLQVALDGEAFTHDPVAATLRLPPAILTEILLGERAEALIVALGLEAFRDKRVSQLSTGSRRVVELASLVAQNARVLLLDEPSAGIAQREAEALGPLLRRLRDATGSALVIVEHDVALLRSTCDRLVAMDLGAVIAVGPPDEVLADPLVATAYLGSNIVAVERSGKGRRRQPLRSSGGNARPTGGGSVAAASSPRR